MKTEKREREEISQQGVQKLLQSFEIIIMTQTKESVASNNTMLENLVRLERMKAIRLHATRLTLTCENSANVVNEYVGLLIEEFGMGNPSHEDFERLRALNLKSGALGVEIVQMKMALAEEFDSVDIWMLGGEEEKAEAESQAEILKRGIEVMTAKAEEAQRECSRLGTKVQNWRKERREKSKIKK